LVKALEEEFGVSAAAPVMAVGAVPAAGVAEQLLQMQKSPSSM
jgi:large subunit ribosomal protein L7/L12